MRASPDAVLTNPMAQRKLCPMNHSDKTYALIVRDNSMTSPSSESIPKGYVILVDPEQRESVNAGDLVVAKVAGQLAVTFRQLADRAGKTFLKPLNSQYPSIDDFTVLGKVIFVGRET